MDEFFSLADDATIASERRALMPRYVGPYRLRRKIGEGGMGTVWLADQKHPFRRRVAIKLIRAGLNTKRILARFEVERQALALMDHQNIARVFEAGGTEDNEPFFAMELVEGVPITQYCDANCLTIRERLQLMRPVCDAIQHAHQKGIVHRDLKPSNILVTVHDGKPIPKVIDFGLAKALQPQTNLADGSVVTEVGQLVGTIQYMSPEQAELDRIDIDTRTDIYSLGALIYRLLTGATPFQHILEQTVSPLRALAAIREHEPPRASQILSSAEVDLPSVCRQRRTDATKLKQALTGELDWIVGKAMDRVRSRRYATAAALGDDLGRYLTDDVVSARPPSFGYLVGKALRKYRGAVVATGVATALLVAGISFSTVYAIRAARNARHAEEASLYQRRTAYNSRLRSASLLVSDDQWREAAELLEDPETCPEEMREFAHQWLWTLSHRKLCDFRAHSTAFSALATSPDSQKILTAARDGSAWLWDRGQTDGVRLSDPTVGTYISCATFSSDGTLLAIGSTAGTIRVVQTQTGAEVAEFKESGPILDLVISADGTQLCVLARASQPTPEGESGKAGYVRFVKLTEHDSEDQLSPASDTIADPRSIVDLGARLAVNGEQHLLLFKWGVPEHPEQVEVKVTQMQKWSDEQLLVSSLAELWVMTWSDGATGYTANRLPIPLRTGEEEFHLSDDGQFLVVFQYRKCDVWDLTSMTRVCGLTQDGETYVRAVASLDNGVIISANEKGWLDFWNPVVSDRSTSLQASEDETFRAITDLCVLSHGTLGLAEEDAVRIVRTAPASRRVIREGHHSARQPQIAETVRTFELNSGVIHDITSLENRALAAVTEEGALFVINLGDGSVTELPPSPEEDGDASAILSVAVSHHNDLLATGGADGRIVVWDLARQETIQQLDSLTRDLHGIAFGDQAGECLLAAGRDGIVRVFDVPAGSVIDRIEITDRPIRQIAISPDRKTLCVMASTEVWMLDWEGKQEVTTIATNEATAVRFLNEGKTLAIAQRDTIQLYDAATGQHRLTLPTASQRIQAIEALGKDDAIALVDLQGQLSVLTATPPMPQLAFVKETVTAGEQSPQLEPALSAAGESGASTTKASATKLANRLTDSLGMRFSLIPEGEFQMGSAESSLQLAVTHDQPPELFDNEQPQRLVRLTRPYYFGETEVTAAQFREFVEATGYVTEAERDQKGVVYNHPHQGDVHYLPNTPPRSWRDFCGEEHPAVGVSWNDAVAFCAWVSEVEGVRYRLPTEAEWERACRYKPTEHDPPARRSRGVPTPADPSTDSSKPNQLQTESPPTSTEGEDTSEETVPPLDPIPEHEVVITSAACITTSVYAGEPNANGLYGLHSNVWEWCADGYDPRFYASASNVDPLAKVRDVVVMRGGCFL